jgi:hypothetical protein
MKTQRRRRCKQTRHQKGGDTTYRSYTNNASIPYPKNINSFWNTSKKGFFKSPTPSAYLNKTVLPYITTLYKQLQTDYETIDSIFRSNTNNDFNFEKFSNYDVPNHSTPVIGSNKYMKIHKLISNIHNKCKIIEYVCTNTRSKLHYYTPEQQKQICILSDEANAYLNGAIHILQYVGEWEQNAPVPSSGTGNYNIPNPYSNKNGKGPISYSNKNGKDPIVV